jgi:hypothetical protein
MGATARTAEQHSATLNEQAASSRSTRTCAEVRLTPLAAHARNRAQALLLMAPFCVSHTHAPHSSLHLVEAIAFGVCLSSGPAHVCRARSSPSREHVESARSHLLRECESARQHSLQLLHPAGVSGLRGHKFKQPAMSMHPACDWSAVVCRAESLLRALALALPGAVGALPLPSCGGRVGAASTLAAPRPPNRGRHALRSLREQRRHCMRLMCALLPVTAAAAFFRASSWRLAAVRKLTSQHRLLVCSSSRTSHCTLLAALRVLCRSSQLHLHQR